MKSSSRCAEREAARRASHPRRRVQTGAAGERDSGGRGRSPSRVRWSASAPRSNNAIPDAIFCTNPPRIAFVLGCNYCADFGDLHALVWWPARLIWSVDASVAASVLASLAAWMFIVDIASQRCVIWRSLIALLSRCPSVRHSGIIPSSLGLYVSTGKTNRLALYRLDLGTARGKKFVRGSDLLERQFKSVLSYKKIC